MVDFTRSAVSTVVLGTITTLHLVGCGRDAADERSRDEVTWRQHIAPIVTEKCRGCHTKGGIAPLSFDTYEEVSRWLPMIAQDVKTGRMPPWGAQETEECTPPAGFKNDVRLTDDQKAQLLSWIEQGAPEGAEANTSPLPEVPELALKDPSAQLSIKAAIEVDGERDRFVCFPLDPQLTEDVYVTATQVVSGNNAIVHHVLVFADPFVEAPGLAGDDGYYDCFGSPGVTSPMVLSAWAPGGVPEELPKGVGVPLRAGSGLVMQVHYHPTSGNIEVDDSTRFDVRWTQEELPYVGATYLIGNFSEVDQEIAGGEGFGLIPGSNEPDTGPAFVIPANVAGHVEKQRMLVPGKGVPGLEFSLFSVAAHMHYIGKDMKISVERSKTGDEECLMQEPAYDFNWQRIYHYDSPVEELPRLYPGDALNLRCTYDNTMGNAFVRRALAEQELKEPQTVNLGESSLEEMCVGVFGVAVPRAYRKIITDLSAIELAQ